VLHVFDGSWARRFEAQLSGKGSIRTVFVKLYRCSLKSHLGKQVWSLVDGKRLWWRGGFDWLKVFTFNMTLGI
jgi:hypothetical protein